MEKKRYQDYVIKNGKFIGDFEKMYQHFDDPWHQSLEIDETVKHIAIYLLKKYKLRRVLEIGCGLGFFSNMLYKNGFSVTAIDISNTAIDKAKHLHKNINFKCCDFMDHQIYNDDFDVIVMSEITWYILDRLDCYIKFLKSGRCRYLLHMLTIYDVKTQEYGREKFTDIDGIMDYFGMDYLEFGICNNVCSNSKRTFFIAKI